MGQLKVREMAKVQFDPPALLVRVLRIAANLYNNSSQPAAVSCLSLIGYYYYYYYYYYY